MFDSTAWAEDRLSWVPNPWQDRLRSIHAHRLREASAIPPGTGRQAEAERSANIWLFDKTERIAQLRVPINLKDAELCEMADNLAKRCMSLAEIVPGILLNAQQLRRRLAAFVANYGIEAPGDDVEDQPAIARMTDNLWWRRKLRVHQARLLEAEAIALGYVHRREQIYASDATVERRTQQRRRNALALENTELENCDTGESYVLADLAERSVANPKIRRGELMVRIKGFEHVAQGLGHISEFVTLTTPSKFHPKRTNEKGRIEDNPKFCGATPREAQAYLGKVWARIRAKFQRIGLRCYGFRIAEAHHDATPHWHLLLFLEPARRDEFREIITHYGLAEDGNEPGAQRNRVNFVAIDPTKGTAAGYIAKYVSKNIDGGGYQVQDDVEGEGYESVNTSPRIEAWASTWGIRQFQQIGGPPVGVWRELRRTEDSQALSDTVKEARSAADSGNWRRFVEAMRGPTCERRNLPIRVAYTERGSKYLRRLAGMTDKPLNRYGEVPAGDVFGVRDTARDRVYVSRRYEWRVLGVKHGAAMRPWTRVNNCTQRESNDRPQSRGFPFEDARNGKNEGPGRPRPSDCEGRPAAKNT